MAAGKLRKILGLPQPKAVPRRPVPVIWCPRQPHFEAADGTVSRNTSFSQVLLGPGSCSPNSLMKQNPPLV
jgi:hypothetical protein